MVESSITRTPVDERRTAQRRALLALRAAIPAAERARAEEAIADRLGELLHALDPRAVLGVYWPIRAEPVLPDPSAVHVWGARTLALPRVVGRDRPLEFGHWPAGCALLFDRWGIATPEPFQVLQPDLLIVPCIGYDPSGFRLGYGGGFYDRTLAARPIATIGIAFDVCELSDFIAQDHDRPLDLIVTDQRVVRPPARGLRKDAPRRSASQESGQAPGA